jgi:multimeric flavodoxin WrbA
MKITLLNGNPNPEKTGFDSYLSALSNALKKEGYSVQIMALREMKIGYCRGCFDCWIKTPGLCSVEDDSYHVCDEYINADLVIFASPIIMGFTSALLKKANDKLIPLIRYNMELVDNEYHHVARYPAYPYTSLILGKEEETDEEDLEIITEIYRRDAINLKSELKFVKTTDNTIEEVVNEINRI